MCFFTLIIFQQHVSVRKAESAFTGNEGNKLIIITGLFFNMFILFSVLINNQCQGFLHKKQSCPCVCVCVCVYV